MMMMRARQGLGEPSPLEGQRRRRVFLPFPSPLSQLPPAPPRPPPSVPFHPHLHPSVAFEPQS